MLTKEKINTTDLINYLICFLPLSLILGNLATNINIVTICLLGIFTYKFEIFNLQNKTYQFLIFGFFSYLILITLIKYLPNLNEDAYFKVYIIKSLLYLRFLIFFLIVNKLIQDENFNIKLFYIVSSILVLLVCFNIFLIYFNLTDFSLFGNEQIAGGYIQRWALFFIFFTNLLFFNSKNIKKIIFLNIFFITFFIFTIAFSGNRMPLLIFISFFVLLGLIFKQFRKYIIFFIILITILVTTLFKFFPDTLLKKQIWSFYGNSKEIVRLSPKLFYYGRLEKKHHNYASGYLSTFNAGVQTWKKNKIFGGGLKSSRINCKSINDYHVCSMHPHNYLIEILIDTGIVGFTFIYLFFLIGLINFLKSNNKNLLSNYWYTPFFLIFFFEFFPLRSTGSFFTTGNAAYIFFIMAVFINFVKIRKKSVPERS